MLRLPGLVDICTVVNKNDLTDFTRFALDNGYTTLLAAPTDDLKFENSEDIQRTHVETTQQACCEFEQIAKLKQDNVRFISEWADAVPSVLFDLRPCSGMSADIRVRIMSRLFSRWPENKPICIWGEDAQIGPVIFNAQISHRHVHVCGVATRREIELIREAKSMGAKITCDVHPLNLIPEGREPINLPPEQARLLPRLGTADDRCALRDNLPIIDCFSSGYIGGNSYISAVQLKRMPPILLTLLAAGLFSVEDMRARCCDNPRRIFNLPEQEDTYVEIEDSLISPSRSNTTAKVQGVIERVVFHGHTVFEKEKYKTDSFKAD